MTASLRTAAACLLTIPLMAGCATKGQLRTAMAAQTAALEAEREARVVGDERLGSDVATLREDLAALRNDLQTLRTYGEDRLVVPNAERDDPGAELNRRVVFVVESPTAARAITLLDGQGG